MWVDTTQWYLPFNAMHDVVIASLPYVETAEPLMAPALLKGVVQTTGLSCTTVDLNIEILHFLKRYSLDEQEQVKRWFLYQENTTCNQTIGIIDALVNYACDRLLAHNPKWICLSLFCHTAKDFAIKFCRQLKRLNSTIQIVVGGNAVFTDEKSPRPYATMMRRAKLVDHFIVGDGEEPLYNLLTGSAKGVNEPAFQVLDQLDQQPFSDYADYDWSLYQVKRVPMYASRGCVRRCTFCDVYKLWQKFKIRDANTVFAEMLHQIDQTGITDFYFRDSLINGSVSEYKRLMRLIAEYNQTHDPKIKWTSFFIFRPKTQMPESDWALTAAGGADDLVIGVESLVDSMRYHMRKKFTNADMLFGLQMAEKYKIKITMLLIIGYVNETAQDFEAALQWLEDHKHYAQTAIKSINVGGTLTVNDLTDLYQNAEDFDITIGTKIHLWENKKIGLDYQTRENRKKIFIERAINLGYTVNAHEKPVT